MTIVEQSLLKISVGMWSETGQRRRNEDFVGARLAARVGTQKRGAAAAIADGIGGSKGGREAAEVAVRGFLEDYFETPESWGPKRAASTVLQALNSWIFATGQVDPVLAGMGCTFTGLVLRGRTAHVLHVGDTRLYRLSGDRLNRLSDDHVLTRPEMSHVLYRAIGIEETLRLDYTTHPVAQHDRFLLCSDGVHGFLSDGEIARLLLSRAAPEATAKQLVTLALERGSADNASALVLDVLALPPPDEASLGHALEVLPIEDLPVVGQCLDGFKLETVLAEGNYSRLFTATDEVSGGVVVLKFSRKRMATDAVYKTAFIREAWTAARVTNPWLGAVIDLPPGRQSCLYTVMPFYDGETLERRLERRPFIGLEAGRGIGVKLCKAVAVLHRAGIIHRDIKPDNIVLETGGSLKLLDLGVVRVPGLEDFPAEAIPGTPSYMAPEMFSGEAGSEKSDLFALAVTLYRAFTGEYPYREVEAFSRPKFDKPTPLTKLRPDLPAWLEATLQRGFAVDPADRHGDVIDLMIELENGPSGTGHRFNRRPPLYQRNPVLVWKLVSALLALGLLAVLRR